MKIAEIIRRGMTIYERRNTLKILTSTAPEQIVKYGEELLLKAFRRASQRIPAYQAILKNTGCSPEKITSISAFKSLVPVIAKEDVFPKFRIKDICLDGSIDCMRSAMASSGFSGVFSFGINTEKNLRDAMKAIDTTLDYTFRISKKKTLFINSLAMGVGVPTSLPVASTGVRSDMALSIIRNFSSEFDQVIIISDPHFLKKILEDGAEQGIDWTNENINIITGQDWVPETFRSYLGSILGTDWESMDRGMVGGTMGTAELDLSLFHESKDSIRIQRAALADRRLRYALYGDGCDVQPTLFHYYPHRTFLEVVEGKGGSPELVISMLSDSLLIPLIRYNIKDVACIYPYNEICTILRDCGYERLCPALKLPMLSIGGRGQNIISTGSASIAPAAIKHGIYAQSDIAAKTTGYFRLSVKDDAFVIELQLKKGIERSLTDEMAFETAIARYVSAPFKLQIYPYQTFPYSMELDYERKFKNI